jgi:hypothetical protein
MGPKLHGKPWFDGSFLEDYSGSRSRDRGIACGLALGTIAYGNETGASQTER